VRKETEMDLNVHGRVFLVTGGTSGLGLAAARTLVQEGARVVVSSRRQEAVDKAVAELGGNEVALGVAADNADPAAAARLVASAMEHTGGSTDC